MKKHTLVLFSFFASLAVTAQEVVATQGESYSNGSGSIDFTLGEVVIATGTDGTNDLTQGFHQTNWNFLGVEDFAPNYEAIIFPNPTEDVLNIKTSMFENVTYTLYDGLGKLVMQDILSDATNGTAAVYDMAGKRIATQNIHSDRTAFQVNVASGIYIVKLESNKGASTHKIHLN